MAGDRRQTSRQRQPHWLTVLNHELIACTRCPRLVAYREQVAREKRRAYRGEAGEFFIENKFEESGWGVVSPARRIEISSR